jgi:osmotically-inducible protein OsmY
MADRWMDERDREWRRMRGYGRDDERRDFGREAYRRDDGGRGRYAEARSFERDDDENGYPGDVGYEGGRDKVFGQDQSGTSYGGETDRYAPGHLGGPSGYRDAGYGAGRSGWQNPDYGGVSPAMRRGGGYGRGRFEGDDDTRRDYGRRFGPRMGEGGRYYGDDARESIYREEWSQGRRDYGAAPRDYDAGYSETRARYHDRGYGEPGYETASSIGYDPDPLRTASGGAYSGGLGGYDYERGYSDAGRRGDRDRQDRAERTRRFEDAGRGAGEFLHRAGQKMADWFSGGGEGRAYDDRGYDRNRGGRRGLGPQGYKRSDDRISEDAHERLTDDSWLDASNIVVSVSGGEVTLSGTVDSREAKHRAERIVEDVAGVNHVQNNLRVQRGGFLTGDSTGYGDTVAEAQMRRENPTATSTTGEGGGQSTAGRKQ